MEFHPKSRADWRVWLRTNNGKLKSVWLELHKKASPGPGIAYAEAVEDALCFGWIDSKPQKRDAQTYLLYFAERKSGSVWSKINKERIVRMLKQGMMEPEGLRKISAAKRDGSWSTLDAVDALVMPVDLKRALAKSKKALKHFEGFPPSVKKQLYFWIISAKRVETRTQRIRETVDLAAKNVRANQWNGKK